MLMVATLIYCLFIYGGAVKLFRDSDSGWHIRNGERILDQGRLERSDPYSFSKPGKAWFAWEWGADLAMGAAHRVGGLAAVATLFAFAIAGGSWLWVRLHFAMDGDFLLAGALAPLMLTVANAHWLARPHVFGWLLLLGWVTFLERVANHPARSLGWDAGVAILIAAVWANVHGSFFLAPVLALVYAVSHMVRPWVWPLDRWEEHARARRFLAIALAAAAGTLINPYGWWLHEHVLAFLSDTRLTSQIAEFQPFPFSSADGAPMLLLLGIGAGGAVLALQQKKIARFLTAALLVAGGLRSARALPLVALVGLPIANSAIAAALRQTRSLRAPLLERLDAALAYSARLRQIDMRLNGAGFVFVVVALSLLAARTPAFASTAGFPADHFPVAASHAVEALPAEARILASDSYGGYLIYRFGGTRKVFFDGRSDFYGAAFLDDYFVLSGARPGWREIATRYHFTHALLPVSSPLVPALIADGGKVLYRDRTATLLEFR
jgi:hypothetical protein